MQDQKQFEQLMLQYNQLKNGSADISRMIDNEDYDGAITMIKNREQLFLSCKCILKYLELTPVQEKELNAMLDELRNSEIANIKKLEKGMTELQSELQKYQKSQKLQQAYDIKEDNKGSIVNYEE